MKLKSVQLTTGVDMAGHVVTSAAVGMRLATFNDGPEVESIDANNGTVTIRMKGSPLVAVSHGAWSGTMLQADRKGARKQ